MPSKEKSALPVSSLPYGSRRYKDEGAACGCQTRGGLDYAEDMGSECCEAPFKSSPPLRGRDGDELDCDDFSDLMKMGNDARSGSGSNSNSSPQQPPAVVRICAVEVVGILPSNKKGCPDGFMRSYQCSLQSSA